MVRGWDGGLRTTRETRVRRRRRVRVNDYLGTLDVAMSSCRGMYDFHIKRMQLVDDG